MYYIYSLKCNGICNPKGIVIEWERKANQIILQVELPINVSGIIKVKGTTKLHSSGKLKMIV